MEFFFFFRCITQIYSCGLNQGCSPAVMNHDVSVVKSINDISRGPDKTLCGQQKQNKTRPSHKRYIHDGTMS